MNEAGASGRAHAAGTAPRQESVALCGDLIGSQPIETRRRVAFAVVTAFILLALACVIAGVIVWRTIVAGDIAAQAQQTRQTAARILEAALTAESAERGYLLSRDPDHLRRYEAARSDFTRFLAAIRTEPADAALVAEIASAGARRFAILDHLAAEVGRGDEPPVSANGGGRVLMDTIRTRVDRLTEDASREIVRAAAVHGRLNTGLVGAIVTALSCVAGLGVLLLQDARRHMGLLETRETSARRLALLLERRVEDRTRELAEAHQRFAAALRSSGVTVMTQDRDLVFTWISTGAFGLTAQEVIGKSEREVTPEPTLSQVTAIKQSALTTGQPARGDIRGVQRGAEIWFDVSVHPLIGADGETTGIISGAIDITRYKEQEARIRLLMRELTHRSKNLLTVIQAIMRQTAANCPSVEDFETRFAARLQSLAESHDLLVREDWTGASLRELVRSQLGHYIDRAGSQIEMTGDPLQIPPDAAQHIGMAMHELATNAAKHGALSVPTGKVDISWHVLPAPDGGQTCELSWIESGGPVVKPPSRRGFGRVVIERTVARALHGEVGIEYAPTGLRWTLRFPKDVLSRA